MATAATTHVVLEPITPATIEDGAYHIKFAGVQSGTKAFLCLENAANRVDVINVKYPHSTTRSERPTVSIAG